MRRYLQEIDQRLARHLPERRLFLRSETSTSYVRLRPLTQAATIIGVSAFVVWSLVATTILILQALGEGDLRAAGQRAERYFEARLIELTGQRDRARAQARDAEARYGQAMDRVAAMQAQLLDSQRHAAELEGGIEALQASLRAVTAEREAARARLGEVEADGLAARLDRAEARLAELETTLEFVSEALRRTAADRETLAALTEDARREAAHLALEYRLIQERNTRIFTQLEEAVQTSMAPLERMFRAAGIRLEDVLRAVRSGYQARSAALTPIAISTSGSLAEADSDEVRANRILAALQEIDLYRIAAQRTPFAMPVRGGVTLTSGFGPRRDPRGAGRRMHNGVDWAGRRGTPIHATADGTVTFAGVQSGFGKLVILRHDFGIETYYAHLSSIAVRPGQRVSRGERIGAMGSTGRSTGVHLHYEIRVNDRPINPMTFIRAAQNVF